MRSVIPERLKLTVKVQKYKGLLSKPIDKYIDTDLLVIIKQTINTAPVTSSKKYN